MSRYPDVIIRHYKGLEAGSELIAAQQIQGTKEVRVDILVNDTKHHMILLETELYEIFKVFEEIIKDWA